MTSSEEYGRRVRNNAGNMIQEITTRPDGTSRGMSDEMAAGVLVAQANLAIAASLAELADVLRTRS